MTLLQKCAGVAEWQTHQTQNLTGATSCRFESGCRHSLAGAKPKTPSSFLVTRRLDGVFLFHRILHFWGEKAISAQNRGRILHFRREKAIFAQNRGRILHFRRGKDDFCTKLRKDFAFLRGKDYFCTKSWSQYDKIYSTEQKLSLISGILMFWKYIM